MKYGKDSISRGASTVRTPAMAAVIFANWRGTVRIKSVCAMASKEGIVYMLATHEVWHDQSSGDTARHVYPHIMVYAPYLKNSDIAVAPEHVWRPDRVWVQYEGRPDAYLIFEVGSTWSKP